MLGKSTNWGDFSWWWKREKVNFLQVLDSCLFPAPVGKSLLFGPNLDQIYKTFYLMIFCKAFFLVFTVMGHIRLTKVTIANVPPKKWPSF